MTKSVIHILDQNTANKIAAGEVVERPASVVKELVENSLDAYSRSIEIKITDGGVSYIMVNDDGVGMSREDAEISVLRHATSKIGSVDDLYSIHSLGFRGEALPSIASVSHFTLTTRLHEDPLATYVEVNGGVISEVREAGGSVGTLISVSDLFYNTPARLKFLKSATTESNHIHDIIGKLALSHPEVSFKLINNERLVLATSGNDDLLDTLVSLYGTKISESVLPINYENDFIVISGYVAKPTLLKSSRQWQTFVVNSRVISSRLISKALDNAYHSLLPKAGYPLAVVRISLPPTEIDVNVHPQKSEIKFTDESKVFKAVYHAINEALASPHEVATVASSVPVWRKSSTASPSYDMPVVPTAMKLWREEPVPLLAVREAIKQEEKLAGANDNDNEKVELISAEEQPSERELTPLGQVEDCYIIAVGPDGLYVIDQHAAHERILYDRLSQSGERIPVQQLLIPLILDMDSKESAIISENLDLFYELGFNLEFIGPNTLRLSEMPADVSTTDARLFLHDILMLVQNNHKPSSSELRHACLQTAACRAAIKAGEQLNMRQIKALISELSATAFPYTCPHGRPTIIKFSPDELAKMFKRT